MGTLDEVERFHQGAIRRIARTDLAESACAQALARVALLTFVATPFLIIELLFVMILGQILIGLALVLTLHYLRLKRSWRLLLAGLAGALGSFAMLISFATADPDIANRITYILMLLATIGTVIYIVTVGGAIWSHYNRASARYSPTA